MKAARPSNTELRRRDLTTRIFAGMILYLGRFYPHVDLEALSLEAGLPLAYLKSDQWVSAEFAVKFTKLCVARTGDQQLLRKAGEFGIVADLTGKVFFRLISAALSVDTMYAQLTRLTQMFNRVTRVDRIVAPGEVGKPLRGKIVYKLSFDVARKSEFDPELRVEILKSVLESSLGYYSAMPTAKGLPPARVRFTENMENGEQVYFLTIEFDREKHSWGFPLAALGVLAYFSTLTPWVNSLGFLFLLIGGILIARDRSKTAQARLQTTLDALEISERRYVEVIEAQKKTEELAESYSRFVPWEFFHQMSKESVLEVELGTQRRIFCGVSFADIRNFTTISEELGPEGTFELLNRILADITPAVASNGGFVDSFQGDGVMALFPGNDGGARALRAGQDMQALLEKFRAENRYPYVIEVVIGVHCGPVTIGTIGNKQQMSATVIGDAVNVASRLQELAKERGLSVAASHDALKNLSVVEAAAFADLSVVQVRGRRLGLHVYGVETREKAESGGKIVDLSAARAKQIKRGAA